MYWSLRLFLTLAGLVLVGVLATGCDSVDVTPRSESNLTLEGPTWQLAGFEAPDGTTTGPGTEPISIDFDPEGAFDGESKTNTFDGVYAVQKSRFLSINRLYTTLAGLPDGSRYLDFYSALRAAQAYRITDGTLRIRYSDDGKTLLFEKVGPRS